MSRSRVRPAVLCSTSLGVPAPCQPRILAGRQGTTRGRATRKHRRLHNSSSSHITSAPTRRPTLPPSSVSRPPALPRPFLHGLHALAALPAPPRLPSLPPTSPHPPRRRRRPHLRTFLRSTPRRAARPAFPIRADHRPRSAGMASIPHAGLP